MVFLSFAHAGLIRCGPGFTFWTRGVRPISSPSSVPPFLTKNEESQRSMHPPKIAMSDSRNNTCSHNAPLASPLPAHSIRISGRARRIGLRVLPGRGLEVVLPRHADPACVPALLARHRAWIEKHLSRMRNESPRQEADRGIPERLLLKGGLEEVRIRRPALDEALRPGKSSGAETLVRIRAIHPSPVVAGRDLALSGDSPALVLRRLREWVREEARVYLSDLLDSLAREHGFSYASLSIRFQRGRWGSCSARGSISLNACLLFLPERLTRHILLHELCHTRQLNHSQAFWKQLFAVDPNALAHDKAMRHAWRHVPAWIFTD